MENTRQRYPVCKLPQPYPAVSHPKQDARTATQTDAPAVGKNRGLSPDISHFLMPPLPWVKPFRCLHRHWNALRKQNRCTCLCFWNYWGQLDVTPRHAVVSAAPFTTLAALSNPIKQIEALRSLAIAARKQYEKEATEYAAASPAISQLLSRLAQDEQHHAALLYHLPKRLG